MELQFTRYEKKDRIAYVTINRPEVMNALHPPSQLELKTIWQDFDQDPECWVAIFTGAGGRAFCAGNDLKYTAEAEARGEDAILFLPEGFGAITNPRFRTSKPVIAAVNGYALGGGMEMALACDLIIAADHARIGLPEPRVGLAALAGGMHRLPRQLPLKVAMGMLLTGRHMTVQEAYQYGLVNEVVPISELIPTAERWAKEILECAPLAVRGTLQGSMTGLDLPLEAAINNNYSWLQAHMRSADRVEGPKAFVEKRPPSWKGR